MSTRAQIGIYKSSKKKISKPDVLLYKHSDGYPDGVIPIIEPFLKRFDAERGIADTEYCGAWLSHALVEESIENMKKWFPKKDGKSFLGHGICKNFHEDIEYFYRVYPNTIEIYETKFDSNPESYILIKTIKLKEEA